LFFINVSPRPSSSRGEGLGVRGEKQISENKSGVEPPHSILEKDQMIDVQRAYDLLAAGTELSRRNDFEGAGEKLTAVIDTADLPLGIRYEALRLRAAAREKAGDKGGAVADILESEGRYPKVDRRRTIHTSGKTRRRALRTVLIIVVVIVLTFVVIVPLIQELRRP
jgi:hypothetical protein